jgi:hypothetical protein
MGTNYYVHTPGCPSACEHCSAALQLHLGKSSVGWRFLHQAEDDWPREQAHNLWLELIEAKQDGRSHTGYSGAPRGFLYDSMRNADFESSGYDFCDRYFS